MVTSKSRRERYLARTAADQGKLKPTPPAPAPTAKAPKPKKTPVAPAPAPEPVGEEFEVNFLVPPGELLFAEGAMPVMKKPQIPMDPALWAHWQEFARRNPDMKIFSKTARALLRVLMREEETLVEAARAEARRTGVPVRPEVGPFMKAVREERRMLLAEESGAIFDD
jgi:hypothetical protein